MELFDFNLTLRRPCFQILSSFVNPIWPRIYFLFGRSQQLNHKAKPQPSILFHQPSLRLALLSTSWDGNGNGRQRMSSYHLCTVAGLSRGCRYILIHARPSFTGQTIILGCPGVFARCKIEVLVFCVCRLPQASHSQWRRARSNS